MRENAKAEREKPEMECEAHEKETNLRWSVWKLRDIFDGVCVRRPQILFSFFILNKE